MSYILGLNLNETSIGIVILDEKNKEPISLRNLGVRIFSNGRDNKTQEPLAVKRRQIRGIRKNLSRRNRRKRKLLNFLIENNLISKNEEERKSLKSLDPYELRAKALDERLTLNELSRALIHINQRRGFLSNRKVDKEEEDSAIKNSIKRTKERIEILGYRTLGEYLSSIRKKDSNTVLRIRAKDSGQFKLIENIDDKNDKVIFEKDFNDDSIYNYYTDRELYKTEVIKILEKQKQYYPQLNDKIFDNDTKKEVSIADKIFDIIFYQRDLKPQNMGMCQLEPNEPRIAKAHPLFQKFRILSNLNNLKIYIGEAGYERETEPLKIYERSKILDLLNKQKSVTLKAIRKDLKISNIFNLEESAKGKPIGEVLNGNSTAVEMRKYIKNWDSLSKNKQCEYVEKLLSNSKDDEIIEYFIDENIELTDEIDAYETKIDENGKTKRSKIKIPTDWHNLLDIKLEVGYGNLSKKAIEKLLPLLEEGEVFIKACNEIYGYNPKERKSGVYDKLPYYGEILERSCIKQPNSTNKNERELGKVSNVTIHIVLNQLRKVVNDIIDKYGKPSNIIVGIDKSLKYNKKDKAKEAKIKKLEEKRNNYIREQLAIYFNVEEKDVKKEDIYKYKVWENLSKNPLERVCPFCGKLIEMEDLFKSDSSFTIEHLLPFSRSYDDSLNNKVISCSSCSKIKENKTPFEAFSGDDRWNEILSRVSLLPKQMQWRFNENTIFFNLDDTEYLAKAIEEYLDCLYENDGNKHISVLKEKLIAMLRYNWGLDNLINEMEIMNERYDNKDNCEENKEEKSEEKNNKKSRADHRYHAIDAFLIACINNSTLNKISRASEKARIEQSNKLIDNIEPPFESFDLEKIRNIYSNMIISLKSNYKNIELAKRNNTTIAQLHNSTLYGLIERNVDGNGGIFATRIPIKNLNKKIIESNIRYIADEKIRGDLQELVEDIDNESKIKNIIENYTNTALKQKDGTPITIKNLRIHEYKPFKSLIPIKDKNSKKEYAYAETDGNYCAEVYMPNRGNDKNKWCIEIISNFDAHRKDFKAKWKIEEPEAKLIMRLFINDMLEIEINKDNKNSAIKKLIPYAIDNKIIVRVRKLSGNIVYLMPNLVAKENKDGELTWAGSGKYLQISNAKKIRVSSIGEITYLKK